MHIDTRANKCKLCVMQKTQAELRGQFKREMECAKENMFSARCM
jgi:hypothetical protein